MKTFKTILLTLAVVFSFTACEKIPTEGFKVEGSIANFQDYQDNKVMVFVGGGYGNIGTKISESKFENNYFSMFLPYEIKDKYCNAISADKLALFNPEFEPYLTISNENVKVIDAWFNSNKEYYFKGNIMQFGYKEKFYNNEVADVTLVKTRYIYAQSAVSITGDYEARLNGTGADLYKTVKMDLFLQKGWNIIYKIGNYISQPNTCYWEIDTAIINITTEKPENIELKWYYEFGNKFNYMKILENENAEFIYMPFMTSYKHDFILLTF